MDIVTIIIGVILFAIATVIVFSWGLVKQKNQSEDLLRLLFSKGASMVKKQLKKKEYITVAEIEKMSKDLSAGFLFSKNRAIVKDTKDYTEKLVAYMIKTGQVKKEGNLIKKNK